LSELNAKNVALFTLKVKHHIQRFVETAHAKYQLMQGNIHAPKHRPSNQETVMYPKLIGQVIVLETRFRDGEIMANLCLISQSVLGLQEALLQWRTSDTIFILLI